MYNRDRAFFEKNTTHAPLPPLPEQKVAPPELDSLGAWFDWSKMVYIDTETTNGHGKGSLDAFDPESNIAIVQTYIDGKIEIRRWNDTTRDWIIDLNSKGYTFVFHNAPFDLFFLRMKGGIVLDKIFDTMIASQVINAGKSKVDEATRISRRQEVSEGNANDIMNELFDDVEEEEEDELDVEAMTKKANFYSHSLGAVVFRYSKEKIVKDLGNSDWSRDPLTPEQVRYAEDDVRYLERVVKNMMFTANKYGMNKVLELEMELLPAVVDMRFNGILIDKENWKIRIAEYAEMSKELEGELNYTLGLELAGREDMGDSLFGIMPLDFSVSSNTQLKRLFKDEIIDGKPIKKVDEGTLKLIKHPEIKKILTYKEYTKLSTTYGQGYLKHIRPGDGRIHAALLQTSNSQGKSIATGRFCVRKGSKVSVVNSTSTDVYIENIKVGDLVYTYDDDLNLTVKPVANVWVTGVQQIVRVHWTSTGRKHSGYLDCTPEHRLRLSSGEYVKVKDIVLNNRVSTRVLALHRKYDTTKDCFERNYTGVHTNNHIITRIEYLNIEDETFDIEVEDTHNFIVNEICTHNSSSNPNL